MQEVLQLHLNGAVERVLKVFLRKRLRQYAVQQIFQERPALLGERG